MDKRTSFISVQPNDSIIYVFQRMAETGKRLFLVFDYSTFIGVISLGDIQRAIIENISLNSPIKNIIRKNFRFGIISQKIEDLKQMMLQYRMECLPILDERKKLVKVLFWEDIISDKYINCEQTFDLPIVIMAGGFGTRLKPLTNILPKPLIPIKEKTIIEDIMDRFVDCGSNKFYLSLNYKADFIRNYFHQLGSSSYIIEFIQEDRPLGTAGSLSLLHNKIDTTFFVSNCDIIINEDYSQILKYHHQNNNVLTIVTALKTISIPYGVVEMSNSGYLKKINEKPDISIQINTGMYILEPQLLDEIKEDSFMHITQLIDIILKRRGKVGCFPISEKSWIDVGSWEEYIKLIK